MIGLFVGFIQPQRLGGGGGLGLRPRGRRGGRAGAGAQAQALQRRAPPVLRQARQARQEAQGQEGQGNPPLLHYTTTTPLLHRAHAHCSPASGELGGSAGRVRG